MSEELKGRLLHGGKSSGLRIYLIPKFCAVKLATWTEEVLKGHNSKILKKELNFLARINRGSSRLIRCLETVILKVGSQVTVG